MKRFLCILGFHRVRPTDLPFVIACTRPRCVYRDVVRL